MDPLLPALCPRFLHVALCFIFAVPGVVIAQDAPKAPAQSVAALRLFFELGLPDTKAAKWVRAEGLPEAGALFSEDRWGRGDASGGNAWVLSEQNGEVDLLVVSGARTRAAVAKPGIEGEPGNAGLPQVSIAPADWAKDAAAFLARLKKVSEKNEGGGDEQDYRRRAAVMQCGPGVLFLAHAHRRGDLETPGAALPLLFSLAGGPEAAIDSAISTLANQRLKSLAEEWTRGSDAKTYAAALDSLAAQFSRGWDKVPAARHLAHRLRSPAIAADQDAEAKEAAALLLSLQPSQLEALPPRQTWMLPEAGGEAESGGPARRASRYVRRRVVTHANGETNLPEEVTSFFAKRHRAARALASLLGDQRMLRVLKGADQYGYSYSFSSDSGEEPVERSYNAIPRPKELGELCGELLYSVLPQRLQYTVSQGEQAKAAVFAWLDSIAKLSDDDLAWEYMRGADQASDEAFQVGLRYLVENGAPESRAKLDEVFLDPAVWSGDSDEVIGALEKHAQKRPGDPAEFRDKLLAVVKKAQDDARAEQMRYMSGSGSRDYAKQLEKQNVAFRKRVEQAFKPVKLEDLVSELLSAPEEDALMSVQTLGPALAKVSFAEAEAQLLQAAVKTKSDRVKQALLTFATDRANEQMMTGEAKVEGLTPAAASALKPLLQDESAVSGRWGGEEEAVADLAAMAVVMARWKSSDQELFYSLMMTAPSVLRRWTRERALALADGRDGPPAPSEARISDADAKRIIEELAALPAGEASKALADKSLDEQLAVAAALQKPETVLPESLRVARLTITRISGEAAAKISAEQWKGKVLSEQISQQVMDAVEKSALEGQAVNIMATVDPLFAGVTLRARDNKQKLSPRQIAAFKLELPAADGPPVALLSQHVSGNDRAMLVYPLWKDAAKTKAWRAAQENKAPSEKKDGEHENPWRSDPAAVAKGFKALLEAAPEYRNPRVMAGWHAAFLSEKEEIPGLPDFDTEE